MNDQSSVPEELEKKIVALIEGQLGPEEAEALAEQIASSKDLRDAYMRHARLHAMLAWSHGQGGASPSDEINPAAVAELLDEAERASQELKQEEAREQARLDALANEERRRLETMESRRQKRPEPIVIPYSAVYLSAAALAALVFWIGAQIIPWGESNPVAVDQPTEPKVSTPPPLVATIVGSVDAKWRDPAISLEPGTRLPAKLHSLDEGIVQIRFDNGAEAVIEAPTDVDAPTPTIGNLGYECGGSVDRRHDVAVQVFSGEVSAALGDSNEPTSIREGQAVHVDAETLEIAFVEADPIEFVRRLPPVIEFVGRHVAIGENLRTTTVAKPLDADGDNVFGTAGYYFFNSNDAPKPVNYVEPFANLVFERPSFVDAPSGYVTGLSAGAGVYSVNGMPDTLDIDDPRLPAGEQVADINSGILSYDVKGSHGVGSPQGNRAGLEIELCRIFLGQGIPASGFRLGVFTDNGDLEDTVPGAIRVSVNDVSKRVGVASRDLNGDIYFFDIKNAQPGDRINLHLLVRGLYASIGGLTFDLPTGVGLTTVADPK